ncbi:hypothetical protein ACFXEB_08545 [Aerococcus urinaeequi]|jgi:hypothetical protein|uniref:hypothetical protein n=1 Tax=Aerococcus urinaeequi TaxID=51665 RepID=UPI00367120F0
MDKKGFGTNVGRQTKSNKDTAKKTVLKSIRVSEQAHKQLRIKSVETDKSIRELIDELLGIK